MQKLICSRVLQGPWKTFLSCPQKEMKRESLSLISTQKAKRKIVTHMTIPPNKNTIQVADETEYLELLEQIRQFTFK